MIHSVPYAMYHFLGNKLLQRDCSYGWLEWKRLKTAFSQQ